MVRRSESANASVLLVPNERQQLRRRPPCLHAGPARQLLGRTPEHEHLGRQGLLEVILTASPLLLSSPAA